MFQRTWAAAMAVAAALAAAGCGEPGPVTITEVSYAVRGDRAHILIDVINPTAAPIYVYAEPRRVHFDPSTRALRLVMHEIAGDGVVRSSADLHFSGPRYQIIAAQSMRTIHVELAATLHHLVFPTGIAGQPSFEPWLLATAARVDVELGWSDRPIAITSGAGKSAHTLHLELIALERGLLTAGTTR